MSADPAPRSAEYPDADGTPDAASPPTDRTRVRRLPKRGRYDRSTVEAILDEAIVGHVAWTLDGQPYATPTNVWREGDRLFWHGSAASRMLRATDGQPVCVTVTHLDGFVLARSGFNHSVNYRSVMILGTAHLVTDEAEAGAALDAFIEHLFPGRAATLRPMTAKERKATSVMWIDLAEASAKVRADVNHDDEGDESWPAWGGVVPVRMVRGAPEPDEFVPDGMTGAGGPAALAGPSPLRPPRRPRGPCCAAPRSSCGRPGRRPRRHPPGPPRPGRHRHPERRTPAPWTRPRTGTRPGPLPPGRPRSGAAAAGYATERYGSWMRSTVRSARSSKRPDAMPATPIAIRLMLLTASRSGTSAGRTRRMSAVDSRRSGMNSTARSPSGASNRTASTRPSRWADTTNPPSSAAAALSGWPSSAVASWSCCRSVSLRPPRT